MISDRYIDDIINDGQQIDDKKSADLDKIAETLALKIDNKLDAAIKKLDEKLVTIDSKDGTKDDNKDDIKDDTKDDKKDEGEKEDE